MEWVYTEYTGDSAVSMPDVRIYDDKPEYCYAACRGYSASVAVFDIDDRCIGWKLIDDLGYRTVREWMAAR